jgi:sugar-specific transcriptional regulator TrmB
MLKTLVNLGFKKEHAEVYIFLATEGPRKASEIVQELRIYRQQLYRVLRYLKSKGVITVSSDYPTVYSAILFEKTLDLLIEAKTEQQKALLASKKELLSTWRFLTRKENTDT